MPKADKRRAKMVNACRAVHDACIWALPMPSAPFILLDDARPGGAPSRLYRAPVELITADRVDQVVAGFFKAWKLLESLPRAVEFL